MDYKISAVQMNFLRLLTKRVFQNITYSCYMEKEDDCTVQLQGENEMELKSLEKTKPRFVHTDFKVQTNSYSYDICCFVNYDWDALGSWVSILLKSHHFNLRGSLLLA